MVWVQSGEEERAQGHLLAALSILLGHCVKGDLVGSVEHPSV